MSLSGGLLGDGSGVVSGSGTNIGIGGDGGINVGVDGGGIDVGIGGGTGGSTDGGGTGGNTGGGNTGGNTSGGGNDGTGGSYNPETGSNGPAQPNQHKSLSFHISNGQVTSVSQYVNGVLVPVSVEPNEFYTLDGNDVINNKILHFGTEATRYGDPDHDGFYTRQSELWTITLEGAQSGTELPLITQLLPFAPTNGNDFLAVRDSDYCLGGSGSDNFVFREAGHLIVGDFHQSEGDKIVIDTALGVKSQEQLESYVTGINDVDGNLVVDFGPAVSITLVGVNPNDISWNDVSILS